MTTANETKVSRYLNKQMVCIEHCINWWYLSAYAYNPATHQYKTTSKVFWQQLLLDLCHSLSSISNRTVFQKLDVSILKAAYPVGSVRNNLHHWTSGEDSSLLWSSQIISQKTWIITITSARTSNIFTVWNPVLNDP